MSAFDGYMRGARRSHLQNIDTTGRKIVGIYQRAAEDLARRAGQAKDGSLTERWLKDYREKVSDRVGQLRRETGSLVRQGMRDSAALPGTATQSWLNGALERAGVDRRFRSVFGNTPDTALRALLDGRKYRDGKTLSQRIWTEAGRLQLGIEEVCAQGLAQKMSAYRLAKHLEAYLNPDGKMPVDWRSVYPDIPFPLYIDYNAQRLARTMINQSYWAANREIAGMNPFCQAMHWELSPSHYERQVARFGPDECTEYAEHDEGLGTGNFPIQSLPFPHPQCMCSQYQVVPDDLNAVADRLANWIEGGSDPELDAAFSALE